MLKLLENLIAYPSDKRAVERDPETREGGRLPREAGFVGNEDSSTCTRGIPLPWERRNIEKHNHEARLRRKV